MTGIEQWPPTTWIHQICCECDAVFTVSLSHESVTNDVESSLMPYLGVQIIIVIVLYHRHAESLYFRKRESLGYFFVADSMKVLSSFV